MNQNTTNTLDLNSLLRERDTLDAALRAHGLGTMLDIVKTQPEYQGDANLPAFLGLLRQQIAAQGIYLDAPTVKPVPGPVVTEDVAVVQVEELPHRLRSINDPRLRIPDEFRRVWRALYRKAQRQQRDDRLVKVRISTLAKLADVKATETVTAAIRFLDSIGAIIVVFAPSLTPKAPGAKVQNKYGEIRTAAGAYIVPELDTLNRDAMAATIAKLPADASLLRPNRARWIRAQRAKNGNGSEPEPTC